MGGEISREEGDRGRRTTTAPLLAKETLREAYRGHAISATKTAKLGLKTVTTLGSKAPLVRILFEVKVRFPSGMLRCTRADTFETVIQRVDLTQKT